MRWIQLAGMQDPADEHDWTEWFADHRSFRDCVFEFGSEPGWRVPPERREWFIERGLPLSGPSAPPAPLKIVNPTFGLWDRDQADFHEYLDGKRDSS